MIKEKSEKKNNKSKIIWLGFAVVILLAFFSLSYLVFSIRSEKKDASIHAHQTLPLNYSSSSPSAAVVISPALSPRYSNKPNAVLPQAEAANSNRGGGFCLSVPVLLYHHVQPESIAVQTGQTSLTVDSGWFDKQMAYLASHGYNTITALSLVNALITHSSLPPKSIVITIDDGYKDDFDYVLPVIQKYHITVNLMIATGLVGGSDFLSWDQINQLKQSGLVYFSDHTWSHYPISRGPQSKIQFEIQTAKQQLEQHTGQVVNIFTYPYGSFNQNAITTLQSGGFIGAFSTIPGFLQCDSFIMTLHRNHIGNAPLSYYGL